MCLWHCVQTRLQEKLSRFEPQPFQPYDENPKDMSANKASDSAVGSLCTSTLSPRQASDQTSSLQSCMLHNGPIVGREVTP